MNTLVNSATTLKMSEDKNSIIFSGKIFDLLQLTKKEVFWVTWTKEEHLSAGLMSIEWNTIKHYWIPDEYLQYAVIHEILCPDMTQWNAIPAIEAEILRIPKDMLKNYLSWRIKFFINVQSYWQGFIESDRYNKEAKNYAQKYCNATQDVLLYLNKLIISQ